MEAKIRRYNGRESEDWEDWGQSLSASWELCAISPLPRFLSCRHKPHCGFLSGKLTGSNLGLRALKKKKINIWFIYFLDS